MPSRTFSSQLVTHSVAGERNKVSASSYVGTKTDLQGDSSLIFGSIRPITRNFNLLDAKQTFEEATGLRCHYWKWDSKVMTSHNGRETLPVASKLPSHVYVLFPLKASLVSQPDRCLLRISHRTAKGEEEESGVLQLHLGYKTHFFAATEMRRWGREVLGGGINQFTRNTGRVLISRKSRFFFFLLNLPLNVLTPLSM